MLDGVTVRGIARREWEVMIGIEAQLEARRTVVGRARDQLSADEAD
jgi:hypothetical protein